MSVNKFTLAATFANRNFSLQNPAARKWRRCSCLCYWSWSWRRLCSARLLSASLNSYPLRAWPSPFWLWSLLVCSILKIEFLSLSFSNKPLQFSSQFRRHFLQGLVRQEEGTHHYRLHYRQPIERRNRALRLEPQRSGCCLWLGLQPIWLGSTLLNVYNSSGESTTAQPAARLLLAS